MRKGISKQKHFPWHCVLDWNDDGLMFFTSTTRHVSQRQANPLFMYGMSSLVRINVCSHSLSGYDCWTAQYRQPYNVEWNVSLSLFAIRNRPKNTLLGCSVKSCNFLFLWMCSICFSFVYKNPRCWFFTLPMMYEAFSSANWIIYSTNVWLTWNFALTQQQLLHIGWKSNWHRWNDRERMSNKTAINFRRNGCNVWENAA